MPKEAPLRLIKRCPLHVRRGDWKKIPPITRGFYVLYRAVAPRGKKRKFEVFYIGVSGISDNASSGVGGRIKHHHKTKEHWTHYSFFEVHDNISREEILELEGLLTNRVETLADILANFASRGELCRRVSHFRLLGP